MSTIRLALVTLTYNNVDEARKTLASIALQDVQPDQILVVDSSVPGQKDEIEKLARLAAAEYVWVEPRGVYSAMNSALEHVTDDYYVWFINSSDWLAGPGSIREARGSLRQGDAWAVGGLYRLGDMRQPFHPVPAGPEYFLSLLQSGLIGFPHPAAVMARRVVRELSDFDEAYRIAADYDLALRVAKKYGPPRIIPKMLAVHVPTGLTSRNKFRHFVEKSVARRRALDPRRQVIELGNLARVFFAQLGLFVTWRKSVEQFPDSPGFGADFDAWPNKAL